MQYLLLIYHNETASEAKSPEEQEQLMSDYWAFTGLVRERGVQIAGEALMPTSTATTVRVKDGKVLTTDGPFAETKEQLGGFYLLECKDLDEAIEYAAKIPDAVGGSIEVRPVAVFG